MTTWHADGWHTLLGAGWEHSYWGGRSGPDFYLETQVRESRLEFQKVLRMQWAAKALGEESYNPQWTPRDPKTYDGKGGLWNVLALYLKKIVMQEKGVAAPREIPKSVVGSKIERLIERWNQTLPTPQITTGLDGTIHIPAAAYSMKNNSLQHTPIPTLMTMPSADDGQQLLHNGQKDPLFLNQSRFEYEVTAEEDSVYFLTANFTTWHVEQDLLLRTTASSMQVNVPVYYTMGYWKETQPIQVKLLKGENVLQFERSTTEGLVFKEFFLFKAKPDIPTPPANFTPTPAPPLPPVDAYIELGQGTTCMKQGIETTSEKQCHVACEYFGFKYGGSRASESFYGCCATVDGQHKGDCKFNGNVSAADVMEPENRALCVRASLII